MKIVGRFALGAVAAAGLVFGMSGPAVAAEVAPHKHCLLTPTGWVPLAQGVSLNAPLDPALEEFHQEVHWGEPTDEGGAFLTIKPIRLDQSCADLQFPPA